MLLLPIAGLRAQITGNGYSALEWTHYDTVPQHTDPIFIYCPDGEGNPVPGSLTARPPGGTAGWDFNWTMYDPATNTYDSTVLVETGVESSTVNGLESGGYAVRIRDAVSLDTVFYAWVFVDTPQVKATVLNYTCDYVALKGDTASIPFYYYNTEADSAIALKNGISFLWTASPPSAIPWPDLEPDPIIYKPPYEDTWYTLTVTDSFGCVNSSAVFYKTIHVKADFEPEPDNGEAPLEVTFNNKSINGVQFEWKFGDDSVFYGETPDPHTYYIPGDYVPVLIATSEEGCVDSISYESIHVEPSELNIPNVFTPNGDGYNDYFRVSAKSLRYLHIKVYNRQGVKVYEFEGQGNVLKDYEGWDGKINGHGNASPGVYYYVIRAVGWDDVQYKGKLYRGAVYLFREKK